MLAIRNLAFAYQDELLFQALSFELQSGELLHLRGANGAGKTTLLRLLAGLIRPLEGLILFHGQSIYQDLAGYQEDLFYLGHKLGVHPLLTLRENLLYDLDGPEDKVVDELIQFWGLAAQADLPTAHLSAGQKRKLSLIRLEMSRGPLWLLDEPLVALDEVALTHLTRLIAKHRAEGGMVIMTSHQRLPDTFGAFREFCL